MLQAHVQASVPGQTNIDEDGNFVPPAENKWLHQHKRYSCLTAALTEHYLAAYLTQDEMENTVRKGWPFALVFLPKRTGGYQITTVVHKEAQEEEDN